MVLLCGQDINNKKEFILATFIEVEDIVKNCKVIVNLEFVQEIAPLVSGGCDLFFAGHAGTGSVNKMRVKDDYKTFEPFAMQMVSQNDIKKKVEKLKGSTPLDKPPAL